MFATSSISILAIFFTETSSSPSHHPQQFLYDAGYQYYGVPVIAPLTAVARMRSSAGEMVGDVILYQPRPPHGPVLISGNVTGLTKGPHGIHIHRDGDTREGCKSMGPHFNPFYSEHGGPSDPQRHVGDLGNTVASEEGVGAIQISDEVISLTGVLSVVGRGLVIHQGEDDLGRGGNAESLKSGNAGERVACGVIAIASSD